MEYFNRFRSTVTQVAAQVSNALPGNPLTREYDVGELVATAGPGFYWRIYRGIKKSTKQAVSVWLLNKNDMEKWPRDDRELFISIMKKGVAQLTRLRHPRLLVVEHAIEESRDSIAFATEPIFACLANCLGRRDNLSPVPMHLTNFSLLEIEIKHGLLQIAEALAFLHIDVRMLHRNICPESIIINEKGAWKLAGFDFAVAQTDGTSPSGQNSTEGIDWNERIPSFCQSNLDYIAPEYIMGGRPCSNSDVYSLGVLSYAVFNKCKTPLVHRNSLNIYRQNMEKLKSGGLQAIDNIPSVFKDDYKMCLNYSPELRPDANQFTKVAYFDDALVKALNYFESLMQMDNSQKMQFFKSLPTVLSKFEKRPLLQKVLPWLTGEFSVSDLIPFILPSIFLIAEQATSSEFSTTIFPQLVPAFSMERPYQIALLLLQRMELLLEKGNEADIKLHVLPLIYNSINSETTRIQELCLSIVPSIGKLVDRNSMKTQLLPKLLKLATEGNVLAIRVQALVCVGKLLPTLESWMITELVLPALPKINSKEPGLLMAILGIYKLSFENESVSIGKEQLAKSVLPFLVSSSVENTLNLGQFEQFISLTKSILSKVENEQRTRLQQLSAGQEEQRCVNFEEMLKPTAVIPQSLDGLSLNNSITSTNTGALTLEEKRRLAAQQESSRRGQPSGGMQVQNNSRSGASSPMMLGGPKNTTSPDFLLGDLMAPTTTNKGAIDVSDFLPSFNQTTATNNSKFFTSPPISQPPQQNIGMPMGGISFPHPPNNTIGGSGMFLPQPPKSANSAVLRPQQSSTGSSLDSLMAFPSKSSTPMSLNSSTKSEQKPLANNNDPFADLLS